MRHMGVACLAWGMLSVCASAVEPPTQVKEVETSAVTTPEATAEQASAKLTPRQVLELALSEAPVVEGVEDLWFHEFYKPIGDYGLEMTERLKSLDGKRVRIAGFMVLRCIQPGGQFLLAPLPLVHHEREYGQADEMPASTVFVHIARMRRMPVPFMPGPLVLTGVLEIGPREEPDARISFVRLKLDMPPTFPTPSSAAPTTAVTPPSPASPSVADATDRSHQGSERVPSNSSQGGSK